MSNAHRRNTSFSAALMLSVLMSIPPAARADVIFRDGFEPGFHVETPELTIAPGDSRVVCYHVRVPTTTMTAVRRWKATLQPGMRVLVVHAFYDGIGNPIELQPPGTLTQGDCATAVPYWLFFARPPSTQLVMPADDGTGRPFGMELAPNQSIGLQFSAVNNGEEPITTSALLDVELLPAGAAFTRTSAYVSMKTTFFIPPGQTSLVSSTCQSPTTMHFWWLSTRTRHFATLSEMSDGANTLVSNPDWTQPSNASFGPPAFKTFASAMTTKCTYFNSESNALTFGEDEDHNEICVGIGYFFPAVRPATCLNGSGPL